MATKTRKRAVKVQQIPETIVNDAPRTFTEAEMEIGVAAHQGDLIFVRITALPTGAKPRKQRQLAEGNTQGSRHILSVGEVFDCDQATVANAIATVCRGVQIDAKYIGPVFRTVEGVADVTHPEHGDHFYRGDMTIACVFQRSLDSEEREQKVRD